MRIGLDLYSQQFMLLSEPGGAVMSDFLSKELRDGLDHARTSERAARSRLRLRVGGEVFTILRLWDSGFSLRCEDAPRLRGHVDLYDGARHIARCLIVASSEDGGERTYDFKRSTPAADGPALDYHRDETAPAGLLGRPLL